MSSPYDPLKARWKSELFFEASSQFVADPDGEFDLRTMTDSGQAGTCTHGGQNIIGRAFVANSPPLTHSIKFNMPNGTKFRGFAIKDPESLEIRKIVGAVKFPTAFRFKTKTAAADQAEATWVATKQP
ncbi:MAG TPA: hypothetical protein DC047_06210 [Blastocatellia bacterium]|nr:hypothetical protein [Blastocatellia bacterium]